MTVSTETLTLKFTYTGTRLIRVDALKSHIDRTIAPRTTKIVIKGNSVFSNLFFIYSFSRIKRIKTFKLYTKVTQRGRVRGDRGKRRRGENGKKISRDSATDGFRRLCLVLE
jgi:hypothetical protein